MPKPEAGGHRDGKAAAHRLKTKQTESPSQSRAATEQSRRLVSDQFAAKLDRSTVATLAWLSSGLALPRLRLAYADWLAHLSISPGKAAQLAEDCLRLNLAFLDYAKRSLDDADARPVIEPRPGDRRFGDAAWKVWPFNWMAQGFLLHEEWWDRAMSGVRGVTAHNENLVRFFTRAVLDAFAPSNFPLTNPVVFKATRRERGKNLRRGALHLLRDVAGEMRGPKPSITDRFKVGQDLAVTPGKVIYRNRLMELIQYAPATATAYHEPILITPAWIMKYYILDLSPHNSLVRYLVEQGHTVFMISWKNPTEEDRDLGMDDYCTLGVKAALDAIAAVVPGRPVHAVGYCVGGTLLSIAAAAMARDGDERLKTITLLAAQTDFSEAGELQLFIDDAQVTYLDSLMWKRGYLAASEMARSFQLLRANDLVWARMIQEYLLGERQQPNDLMSWNADATRMPYRMHSEYLRRLYLNNELAVGRYPVGNRRISLGDIRKPMFVVSTAQDHVAPWHSVYKIRRLSGSQEVTFVLANKGHNGGIVSEPGHRGRSYRVGSWNVTDNYVEPAVWQAETPEREGSWWPEWQKWLVKRSGPRTQPPVMGAPEAGSKALEDAPGTYVLER
ncbi:MAG: PHA/PHB synthase family protein [Gammaproteobacteria bacterium]